MYPFVHLNTLENAINKRKLRLCIGALGLFSKLQEKELLESGLRANKSALERHHLFPKAWLMRNGVTEQRNYNQIANFALVKWNDNIVISYK